MTINRALLFTSLASALYAVVFMTVAALSGSSLAPNPAHKDLKGRLLIADWQMKDPRFSQTVVYIITHDSGGAMGLVINREMGRISFSKLLERLHIEASTVTEELLVRYGGPVEMNRSLMLHSTDMMFTESRPIGEGIAFTVDRSILKAIAEGKGPKHYIFVFGYAGWSPGQLEAELERGDWVVRDGDPSLVFADPAEIWESVSEGRIFSL